MRALGWTLRSRAVRSHSACRYRRVALRFGAGDEVTLAANRSGFERVRSADVDPVGPVPRTDLVGAAREADHLVSRCEEVWDESTADVAGGPRDEAGARDHAPILGAFGEPGIPWIWRTITGTLIPARSRASFIRSRMVRDSAIC